MVSRINLASSDFAYCPKILSNNNGQQRNADLFTTLKKVLTFGGDLQGIESLTITDKKVRVITQDKNFFTVPGVKFDISGTGVTDIDTRHEVTEVFTDGFSFDLDIANAIYTNGLSFAQSPLGWTLLEQDANRLLFRSGQSAVTPFNVYFERRYNTKGAAGYAIYVHFNYDATNFNDLIRTHPVIANGGFLLGSRLENVGYEGTNYKNNYWIYGDDAILYLGFGSSSNTTDFNSISLMCIGESGLLGNSIPVPFVLGCSAPTMGGHWFSNNYNVSVLGISNHSNEAVGTFTGNGYYFVKHVEDNFLVFDAHYTNNYSRHYSGLKSSPITQYNINSYSFLPTYLLNEYFFRIGTIPGFYYLDFNVYSLNPESKNITPYKMLVNNKLRNTAILKFAQSTIVNRGAEPSTTVGCFGLVDLTGPIR